MCPVKKNQDITVEIIDLTYEGLGVAKVDGYPLFIENALPGEKVVAHIMKVGKKFAFAKAIQHLKQSPYRVKARDVQLTQTGIAPLQHLSYEGQLAFKTKQVETIFHKWPSLQGINVLPTIPASKETHYRNKAQVPVRKVDGELQVGFFKKNSHDFVPMTDFYIQDEIIDRILQSVRSILTRFGVSAYNELKHEGVLRHILVRKGEYSNEVMVVLVTRKQKLFKGTEIANEIMAENPEVVSVMQNINEAKTNVILGPNYRCLAGRDVIHDTMLGHEFLISAPSFYQINTKQAERMYQYAIDHAGLTKEMTAIDAYCGIGTITLSLAPHVKEVYGVEVVPQAIEDAIKNAERNHIKNAHFMAGKAEDVIEDWRHEGIHADAIFVDPPRKGLDPQFIQAVIAEEPEIISYISCNPATLARDVAAFLEAGYQLDEVQPFDMFPQTTHIECVAVLVKNRG